MNHKLIFTIVLGVTMLFSACNNSKVTTEKGKEMSDFEIVFESEYGGSGQEETRIIENQGEFAELWVQATMQPAQSAPHIDFSKKIIIAKNFQSKNSGGTEYKIQSVSQKGNNIQVNYTATGPEGMATMAITNPLMILSVDKVENAKVEFINQTTK